jgi:uncharacterized protein (DUF4213/DUF364 family)
MLSPWQIYDILLDRAVSTPIEELIIGLTWTYCQADGIGLCMSPGVPTRTLPWSGTLVGQSVSHLAPWLKSWDSYEATVAMAAINSVINTRSPLIAQAIPIISIKSPNLAVFEYFLPQIQGKKVAVIGRYPGLGHYSSELDLTVIERQPSSEDLPDPAAEYILPTMDWVFLTATSLVNKTFPRLVELSQNAQLVLMGPTLPWLTEFAGMGIDYLAGIEVTNPLTLRQTVAEGGGVRIFAQGVGYRVLKLGDNGFSNL